MLNKKLLIAVTLLTSNLLPITAQVHADNYIDYELCNDLNFGTEDEYPLDKNSNVAITTKLVKEENDDLAIYLYDPTANFKYDSSSNYKVYMNFCNDKVSVDDWSNYVHISKNFNITFDGTTSNGTVTKWIITDFVDDYCINFDNFRSYLINNIHAENYTYVLGDHFVLSPVDKNGYSDLQYTQSNVVTLKDVAVAGWAIDENAVSWWDRYITGKREKTLFYFYGFNVENFTDIDQIYDITIQYNEYTNGVYYQVKNDVNTWKHKFTLEQPKFNQTIKTNLNYENFKIVEDKGYKYSYQYKTYEFNEISSVKDMLQENSTNLEFVNFMSNIFSSCTYVCQFASYDFSVKQYGIDSDYVEENRTVDKTALTPLPDIEGALTSDQSFANWIYKNVTDTYRVQRLNSLGIIYWNTYYRLYQVETTEVKDINMIQMHFKANGIEYDLPVKAQLVPEVPPGNVGEDSSKNDDNINWGEIIAIAFVCVIAFIILITVLKDLFKLLIQGIAKLLFWIICAIFKIIGFILNFALSLITYPFRFIFGHKEFFLWKY